MFAPRLGSRPTMIFLYHQVGLHPYNFILEEYQVEKGKESNPNYFSSGRSITARVHSSEPINKKNFWNCRRTERYHSANLLKKLETYGTFLGSMWLQS
jgi:hypothetical protein